MGYTLDIIRLYLRLTSVVPRVQNGCTQGLIIWYLHFTYNKNNEVLFVTPKIRGSVNQPSTHGKPGDIPDTTSCVPFTEIHNLTKSNSVPVDIV